MFKKRMNADTARELFLDSFEPLTGYENLPVEDCDERIIAEDIIAKTDVPHYRRAAMDGFAVRASGTLGAGSSSPVIFKLDETIKNGTCARVHTGSPVPDGADAVVMVEDTELHGSNVEVFAQVHPLKNVGEIGEDIRKGEVIINKGKRLRPCDIAVIASLGIRKLMVFRKPVVAIIPTGEELIPRGGTVPGTGEVYETNGLMTQLYVRKWGGVPKLFDIVTDNPEKIQSAIEKNIDADMILISGGTSVGKRDFVPGVVASLGELLVHGVGISPGKPTALGLIKGKPVVCMPGYPVAGVVALYWFGREALRKLGNMPPGLEAPVYAVLSEKITSRTGFKTFARVRIENGKAVPLATSGAGILSSVSKADGFVIIPENIEGYDMGETVEVKLID
ncbi:MAG: molybdopterin molybdotransferase MoeA [Candidatus Methanoperedens sp.]|jgi:molybdopterin molybdotransferase|nr:molybdopterin molybdotransferase MoeA [Candidatus Methanoperedens sp.]PKL53440.1 MAG: molybdopterin molybdenumtransferase MoeA [Candidatus Methanoperedenaceae archaeon HGW-Methanoperedenaceae-1]